MKKLPSEHTAKTLIRLGGRPGWSDFAGRTSFSWFCCAVCLFWLSVAFNNFSFIWHHCLVATGNLMLSFLVLPNWSINPQTLDMIPHLVILSWVRVTSHSTDWANGASLLCYGSFLTSLEVWISTVASSVGSVMTAGTLLVGPSSFTILAVLPTLGDAVPPRPRRSFLNLSHRITYQESYNFNQW